MYSREQYLKELISKKDNGRIKIITRLRRSGKSVLLFQLHREWLLSEEVRIRAGMRFNSIFQKVDKPNKTFFQNVDE